MSKKQLEDLAIIEYEIQYANLIKEIRYLRRMKEKEQLKIKKELSKNERN